METNKQTNTLFCFLYIYFTLWRSRKSWAMLPRGDIWNIGRIEDAKPHFRIWWRLMFSCPRKSEQSKILQDCARIFVILCWRKKILNKSTRQNRKTKKVSFYHFLSTFWTPKWDLFKRSVCLCTGQSRCCYKQKKREIVTQRELVMAQKGTQLMSRACPCLSLHLVIPWRNFTLRKLCKWRGSITSFMSAHFVICCREGCHHSEL